MAYAISQGGSTDTVADMAGALAGAHLGIRAILTPWPEGVDDAAGIIGLADSFLSLATGGGSGLGDVAGLPQ